LRVDRSPTTAEPYYVIQLFEERPDRITTLDWFHVSTQGAVTVLDAITGEYISPAKMEALKSICESCADWCKAGLHVLPVPEAIAFYRSTEIGRIQWRRTPRKTVFQSEKLSWEAVSYYSGQRLCEVRILDR
jgi:hypothetical protein